MTCHIVGAGEAKNLPCVAKGDLLIAADGGLAVLLEAGLVPDLVIGDFDSLALDVPKGIERVTLPVEKDETDMAAAVRLGRVRGYCEFCLYGGTGGRPDHTYANYQLLVGLAGENVRACLFDGTYRAAAITNGTLALPARARGTVSVFAVGECAREVTLEGLYYPLVGATLTKDVPLGVSNHIVSHPASVTVGDGTLLVMWEED